MLPYRKLSHKDKSVIKTYLFSLFQTLKARNGGSLFECKGISVFLTLLARSSPMGFQKNLQPLSVVLRVVFF